jgi:hypothetical protein
MSCDIGRKSVPRLFAPSCREVRGRETKERCPICQSEKAVKTKYNNLSFFFRHNPVVTKKHFSAVELLSTDIIESLF